MSYYQQGLGPADFIIGRGLIVARTWMRYGTSNKLNPALDFLAAIAYNIRMSTTTTVLHTSQQINALRAHTIRIGLESEVRGGLRLTGKAPSCYSIVKRELGFKGSKRKVYAQYLLWMEEQGLIRFDDNDRGIIKAIAGK